MLIIVEGVDGVGKTTLAHALAGRTDAEIRHAGPPTEPMLVEYELKIQDYRPGSHRTLICDRWHWGEEVYGPVFRGRSAFTPSEFLHVEMALQARGAVVVHLTADRPVVAQRLTSRGDDFVKVEHLEMLERNYGIVRENSVLSRMEFDTTYWAMYPERVDAAVGRINRLAYMLERAALPLRSFATYVGPSMPKYLILGDTRGTQRGSTGYEAAFVPAPATSGRYILDAMPVQMRGATGIANANEEDVYDLWLTLGEPPVIALGTRAYDTASTLIPCAGLPHPQYVRRFHHRAQRQYGTMIFELLSSGSREDMRTWRPS